MHPSAYRPGILRGILAPLLAALVVAAASAADSGALRAQQSDLWHPPRPRLEDGSDTNDARAYIRQGDDCLHRDPLGAAARYYWASRLEPADGMAPYLRAHALAFALSKSKRRITDRDRAGVDSLLRVASFLDPFVIGRSTPLTRFLPTIAATHEMLRRNQANIPLLVYRASAYFQIGMYDSAAAELSVAVGFLRGEEAKHSGAYGSTVMFEYAIATARLAAGDTAAARAALERALVEDLSFYPAHAALGGIAWARDGDVEAAAREYELALQLQPADAAVRTDYGVVLLKAGRHDEAAAQFLKAIELEPYFANPRFDLALTYHLMGRREEALARYRDFLDRAPLRLARQIDAARRGIAALSVAADSAARHAATPAP